jgi:hypothetical protein
MRARAVFIAALAVAAVLLVACAGPTPAAAAPAETSSPAAAAAPSAAPQQGIQQLVEVTFYAAADNDPPGSVEIAYPNSRHPTAGGTGTAADPLSFATDPREIRPGVLIYYPPIKKYFVMEDDCAECIDQWNADRTPHVDLWVANSGDPAVLACEEALTPDDQDTIIVNPPTNLPVDPKPLFANGKCWPGT